MSNTNRTQMLIGLAVLLLGTLVYLVDRVPEETLVPDSIGLFSPVPSLFGVVGHNLPTFTHVFAFILLTVALLNRSKRISITVCVGWFLVDSAFEVGQHAYFAQWLSTFVPSWFEHIPILAKTEGYFVYGTFDPVDMLSIAAGAMVAYLVIQKIQNTEVSDE